METTAQPPSGEHPPPRRRVLLYVHALETGGAESVTALLAGALAARGHAVTLAVDRLVADGLAPPPGVRLVPVGAGHAGGVRALASLLRAEKPDVSLSALAAGNLKHALAALMAGRGRRAALAWHGYADAEPQTLSRIGFAAIPLATRLAARTICVSDGLAAHIRRRGAPAARVTRIYNPVALATDAEIAQAPALADRAPLALAVGRLAPAKSFATLLRAFARVTHPGARLRIVGEGEERPALEAEIARLGLDERVVLAGRASDMAPHYADARLLALTSTTESFGNVVVEALSRGLPVVGTDCGGPREILDRPGLGALVPVGDEDAIARAIDAAFSEPGDPAPRVARAQDFSIARATDAYERLIEEMIAADADRDRPTPKPA